MFSIIHLIRIVLTRRKMHMLSLCFIFWVFFSLETRPAHSKVNSNDKTIIGVAVLYRHGDRAPISSYPNDPYHTRKYWPEGFGQLTKQGKKRQYDLGKYLRARYSKFLPEEYSADNILVLSSDVDRTIMSASANLAGLYPPTQREQFSEALSWQPIPVHVLDDEIDTLLAVSKQCPKFNRLYQELCASHQFRQLAQTYSDFYKYVAKYTTWNITDIDTFQGLYTTMYVYLMHNQEYLPQWYKAMSQNYKDLLKYLAGLSFSRETYTKELQRFKTGTFWQYLINHFNKVLKNDAQRFLMLSGHDGTIVSTLNTLGVYHYHPPEFASTVIFELFKNPQGAVMLNVFYKINGTEDAKGIVIEDCEFDCRFEKFKEILEPIAMDDETRQLECIDTI